MLSVTSILISAFCIMLASLAGAAFTAKRYAPWTGRNLKHLISFSIGAFVVIIFGLFSEAFHEQSVWLVLVAAIAGALVLEVGSLLIPKAHHHHSLETDHTHSPIDARRMLLGDAIHNIGDGLVLVPAFAINIETGLIAAGAIFIHELVQEISEFFVLKEAGYTNKQALLSNFAVSATILIGIGISFIFSSIEMIEGLLVAFAAGGFLHIVLRDLIPHTLTSMRKSDGKNLYIFAFIAGLVLMGLVSVLAPHSHPQEGHYDSVETILVAREA